jgi:excisionase family DNA binding protein
MNAVKKGSEIPDDLIGPREAADLVGVSRETINRWIRTGELRAWKRGPSRYFVSKAEAKAKVAPYEPEGMPASHREREAEHEGAVAYLKGVGVIR